MDRVTYGGIVPRTGFFSFQSCLADHFAFFCGVCAWGWSGGADDADLAGRAAASPFTMVTRRNLYAIGMGRFVVFYWEWGGT